MALIRVSNASIYLDAETVRLYFPGLAGVIVLIREEHLYILPVRGAAGGYLLKIRNLAGDCVIFAPDVFAAHGLADWQSGEVLALWSAEEGALIAPCPKPAN